MALAASPRDTASHFSRCFRINKKYTLHTHTEAKRSTFGAFDIRAKNRYFILGAASPGEEDARGVERRAAWRAVGGFGEVRARFLEWRRGECSMC